jgi:hypothetical protein
MIAATGHMISGGGEVHMFAHIIGHVQASRLLYTFYECSAFASR